MDGSDIERAVQDITRDWRKRKELDDIFPDERACEDILAVESVLAPKRPRTLVRNASWDRPSDNSATSTPRRAGSVVSAAGSQASQSIDVDADGGPSVPVMEAPRADYDDTALQNLSRDDGDEESKASRAPTLTTETDGDLARSVRALIRELEKRSDRAVFMTISKIFSYITRLEGKVEAQKEMFEKFIDKFSDRLAALDGGARFGKIGGTVGFCYAVCSKQKVQEFAGILSREEYAARNRARKSPLSP